MPKGDIMRVAFGMENEESLTDGHYGDSKYFFIYEINDNGDLRLVEKRWNKAQDMEEREHGDEKKFKAVISQLMDMDVLAAFRMGPNFVRIKEKTKKRVFLTHTKDLNDALARLKNNLEKLKNGDVL